MTRMVFRRGKTFGRQGYMEQKSRSDTPLYDGAVLFMISSLHDLLV
jgi:hypothetical protein